MKTIISTAAALLAFTAGAWAQDADGDGNVSLAELQAVYPEITEETFTAIDTDGDGVLNATEMQAAIDGGQLPS
ncbi:MAG: hypothetical protein AAFY65_17345 [Pseudomonadota bacterium]